MAAVTEAALECVSEAVGAAQAACPATELGESELQVAPLSRCRVRGACVMPASLGGLLWPRLRGHALNIFSYIDVFYVCRS